GADAPSWFLFNLRAYKSVGTRSHLIRWLIPLGRESRTFGAQRHQGLMRWNHAFWTCLSVINRANVPPSPVYRQTSSPQRHPTLRRIDTFVICQAPINLI
ncbi:unnamed protein product, partial [Ectocarpus sp. 12 AP-2014]